MTETTVLHSLAPVGGDAPATLAPRAQAATGELTLSVHRDLAAVEGEWRAFEATADATPFQTFDWLATWQRHIGEPGSVTPAIVIGRRNGAVAFLFPLAVERGRLARRLTFLGQELADYNAPLLAPGFSDAFGGDAFPALWRAVCERLQADATTRHDMVVLAKMPEMVGVQKNPFLALPVARNASNAYQTSLGADWETFYAEKRSSATRRRDRTKLKRLSEMGEVRFLRPQVDETPATLDALMSQKARSFARMGVANLFARPGHAAFFRALAMSERLRGFVHVSRLDVGATYAAVNLGLTHRDCYYHILASYDDGEVSRFGPGAAHLRELLHYAIDRGLKRFDFTIGDEPYKRDWCDAEQRLFDHAAAATLTGWPLVRFAHARARIKRHIKQSEKLWSVAQRLRAVTARLTRREPK